MKRIRSLLHMMMIRFAPLLPPKIEVRTFKRIRIEVCASIDDF